MFKQARLKLTAWYLLIIMFISIFFSGIIFRMLSVEIDRFTHSPRMRVQDTFIFDENVITESKQRVALSLLKLNGIILLVAGTLAYALSGKTLDPISKMVEEQKRFVADASHELRTPLTAMMLDFEVALRDKKLTLLSSKKIIDEGIQECQKLKNLSDSLLELARDGRQKEPKETLRIRDLVTLAVSRVALKAHKKKISISQNTNGSTVFGVKEKLEEVLLILLDNAVKYGKTGGQIKVTAKTNTKNIVIKVADNGPGISPSDLPHIFDRFYRTDSARTKNDEGGYGLGLSIAKKIVEEHGGKIEVKSELGQGSTFSVIFQK